MYLYTIFLKSSKNIISFEQLQESLSLLHNSFVIPKFLSSWLKYSHLSQAEVNRISVSVFQTFMTAIHSER